MSGWPGSHPWICQCPQATISTAWCKALGGSWQELTINRSPWKMLLKSQGLLGHTPQ